MKKWLFIGSGIILAIIIAVIIIGISNLGPILKKVINTYGPEITKTDVHIEKVDVALFKAKVKLVDFYVGNPKGFKSREAFRSRIISMDIDEKSIKKDPVIIERVEIVAPDINYEKIKGTDNFREIIKNVQESIGPKKGEKPSPRKTQKEGKKSKKIIIKDLIIRDGRVSLSMSLLGERTISTKLPDIHLKNIGQKKGGASPEEIARELLSQIYARIQSPDVMNNFLKKLKETGFGMESVKRLKEKALEKLKGQAMEGIKRQVQEKIGPITKDKLKVQGLENLKKQAQEKLGTMGQQKDKKEGETGQIVDQLKGLFNR